MKKFFCLMVFLLSGPAYAGAWCDELWFTRNLVMDQAGYCFGSNLGKTYFNNGDCVGKSVQPSPAGAALIKRVQQMEAEAGCKGQVNTRGTYLDVGDIGIRQMLDDLPLVVDVPSACVGWNGPATILFAGMAQHVAIGRIDPGDNVSFDHEPMNGWIYVTAHSTTPTDPEWVLKSGGWVPADYAWNMPCDQHLP